MLKTPLSYRITDKGVDIISENTTVIHIPNHSNGKKLDSVAIAQQVVDALNTQTELLTKYEQFCDVCKEKCSDVKFTPEFWESKEILRRMGK